MWLFPFPILVTMSIGLLPLVLLVIDAHKKGDAWKGVIHVFVFAFALTITVFLSKLFGMYFVMLIPLFIFGLSLFPQKKHKGIADSKEDDL